MLDFLGAVAFVISSLFFMIPSIHEIIEDSTRYQPYLNMVGYILYLTGSIFYMISHWNNRHDESKKDIELEIK